MDQSVIAAIARWPNVPAVFGWLCLTSRGEWRLRGEPIAHAAIREYIGRNYASDERGRWFFQNGPQRVFVELEVTPWIWHIHRDGHTGMCAHTGRRAHTLHGAWLDETGRAFLLTELGFGLLQAMDAVLVVEALRVEGTRHVQPEEVEAWLDGLGPPLDLSGVSLGLRGTVRLGRLAVGDMPSRFGFVRRPRPD